MDLNFQRPFSIFVALHIIQTILSALFGDTLHDDDKQDRWKLCQVHLSMLISVKLSSTCFRSRFIFLRVGGYLSTLNQVNDLQLLSKE